MELSTALEKFINIGPMATRLQEWSLPFSHMKQITVMKERVSTNTTVPAQVANKLHLARSDSKLALKETTS